jgi:GT2 family glycosyltransferase
LPVVVVSVLHRFEPLDACLAALESSLPRAARVWILDDVSSDPRIEALVHAWSERSVLDVTYRRRQQFLDPAESCNAAFEETNPDDVVLLDALARPTPGWLPQLAAAIANDAGIATAVPWSNVGELCAFPNFGEDNPLPEFPEIIAEAAAGAATLPELPAASPQCVLIRRAALARIGALDATSHPHIGDALADFSLRASSMGWRNVLCDSAYVGQAIADTGDRIGAGNFSRLLARWPDYHERVARFILADPLRALRLRLAERIGQIERSGPQRDLFAAS